MAFYFLKKNFFFPQNACIFIVFLIVINAHGKSSTKWKSAVINSLPYHTMIVTIKSLIHGLPQFFLGIYVLLYMK